MRTAAMLVLLLLTAGCDGPYPRIERAEDAKVSCWRLKEAWATMNRWHCDERDAATPQDQGGER